MAELLRPDGVVSNAGWTSTAGTFQDAINTVSANDASFISSNNNSNHAVLVSLSDMSVGQPGSGARTIRYRYRKGAAAGNARNITVTVYEGGDVLGSWTHTGITEVWTTVAQTIGTDATDWNNVTVQFASGGTTGGPGGNRRTVDVSWAEVEVPDGVAPAGLPVNHWNGSAWAPAQSKVWNGSSWVPGSAKVREASAWRPT